MTAMSVDEFLVKLFDKFDANADGRLTLFEFSQTLKFLTRIAGTTFPNRYDIFDLFARFDSDGDETISREEYKKLTRNLKEIIENTGISLLTRIKP